MSTIFYLEDIIAPLTPDAFLDAHWKPGQPHLSAPNPDLVAKIKAHDDLRDVEATLRKMKSDVSLFGPNKFRGAVRPQDALNFLHAGFNLYMGGIEAIVPELLTMFSGIAQQLGVPPWQIYVEAFAGTPGAVSSRHYDHDTNFQILLDGNKVWRVEENRNIDNPLHAYHPHRLQDGSLSRFSEEAYAHDPRVPDDFSADRVVEIAAAAGSVLYLPRAWWHEVRSVNHTWSLNIVIKGVTWARAISLALSQRLHRRPEFRAYYSGIPYGSTADADAPNVAAEVDRSKQLFETLKQSAHAALDDLGFQEVVLALDVDLFYWQAAAADRQVTQVDGEWQLAVPGVLDEPMALEADAAAAVLKLASFRGSFSWAHAAAAVPDADPGALFSLLEALIDLNLVARSSRVPGS